MIVNLNAHFVLGKSFLMFIIVELRTLELWRAAQFAWLSNTLIGDFVDDGVEKSYGEYGLT